MASPILEVRGFSIGYQTPAGLVRAVQDVSFTLGRGEILGVVGESGSGKSTLVLGALRLLPPPGVILGGEVRLLGRELLAMSEEELRQVRWRDASLVPQSALNALNPVLTVGAQVRDTLQAHTSLSNAAARERGAELFRLVGIDPVHLDSYAHQMSGGMRQRVALAIALALDPPLVVMDEPTTALDVVVEREILKKVLALQAERGFAIVFVTHALSLLLELATRVAVMYAGRLVEIGPVEGFRRGGSHPYTQGLLRAIPPAVDEDREAYSIPGSPPSLVKPPPGCPFAPRCPEAQSGCVASLPALRVLAPGHEVACHLR